MAFTSGFYNSMNHDRLYDSDQVSRLFDGLINDGVYETIGEKFRVTARPTPSQEVNINTGRGWFNHHWVLNDGIHIIDCGASEILLDRIDAVIIEINNTNAVRDGYPKVVHGTPSTSPKRPTLSKANDVYQYPLCYIYRKAGTDTITTANITNMVGTTECPFVIGVIKTMTIDMFVDQWAAEWNEWINAKKKTVDNEWAAKKADINQQWYVWFNQLKAMTGTELVDWIDKNQNDFMDWFYSLQVLLDGDVATNLANQMAKYNEVIETLARDHAIYLTIEDSNYDPILDDDGHPIYSQTIFCTQPCECK